MNFAADQIGHHLLVGRAEAELAVVAIHEPGQVAPVLAPAPGLHPQLGRLHHRHLDLLGAGSVEFLPHDRLHLAQGLQAHRQPRVDARRHAPDEAGAQHQLVAGDLRVGGGFAQGGKEQGAGSHAGWFAVLPGDSSPGHERDARAVVVQLTDTKKPGTGPGS